MKNALGELVAMSDAMPRKSSRQLTVEEYTSLKNS